MSEQIRGTPWQSLDHFDASGSGYAALSSDGRLLIAGLCGTPQNELIGIDLDNLTAFRLIYPDPRVRLADPAISADSSRIAFVVTPPTFFGVGEIRIVDRQGVEHRRIGEYLRSYRYPTFSYDGESIGYLKDTRENSPGDGRRPEFREHLHYMVYETRLSQSSERQVSDRPFDDYCGLFADPLERGYFVCASGPLKDLSSPWPWEERTAPIWGLPNISVDDASWSSRQYFIEYGQRVAQHPNPILSVDQRQYQMTEVIGVLRTGEAILAGASVPDGSDIEVTVFTPSVRALAAFGGDNKTIRASADGSSIVGISGCDPVDPSIYIGSQHPPLLITRIDTRTGEATRIWFSQIEVSQSLSIDR